jgi:hypothetical protein
VNSAPFLLLVSYCVFFFDECLRLERALPLLNLHDRQTLGNIRRRDRQTLNFLELAEESLCFYRVFFAHVICP